LVNNKVFLVHQGQSTYLNLACPFLWVLESKQMMIKWSFQKLNNAKTKETLDFLKNKLHVSS